LRNSLLRNCFWFSFLFSFEFCDLEYFVSFATSPHPLRLVHKLHHLRHEYRLRADVLRLILVRPSRIFRCCHRLPSPVHGRYGPPASSTTLLRDFINKLKSAFAIKDIGRWHPSSASTCNTTATGFSCLRLSTSTTSLNAPAYAQLQSRLDAGTSQAKTVSLRWQAG
jgi:hypothetical protein